jgi:hypothetical protein
MDLQVDGTDARPVPPQGLTRYRRDMFTTSWSGFSSGLASPFVLQTAADPEPTLSAAVPIAGFRRTRPGLSCRRLALGLSCSRRASLCPVTKKPHAAVDWPFILHPSDLQT